MKSFFNVLALGAAVVMVAGCSDSESDSAAPAPVPAKVDMSGPQLGGGATPPPTASVPVNTATTPAATPTEGVTPELTPIQNAIQAFEVKNGRMPANVAELVESGFMQQLPKLPPGRIYYIDHATKQVKIGSDP